LAKALQKISRNADILTTFERLGIESVATSPEQAVDAIKKDMPLYGQIVDMAGVRRTDK
jgi:tripartite-type tricarboxylate transporter receptor subunit TctC